MPPPAATAPARPGRRAATCPPGATRVRRRGSFGRLDDVLVDGAEDALAVLALHLDADGVAKAHELGLGDRKSTRLNSSHLVISYAVFCLKKKKKIMSRLHWSITSIQDTAASNI